MILDVFFNLNDSMILFYDSMIMASVPQFPKVLSALRLPIHSHKSVGHGTCFLTLSSLCVHLSEDLNRDTAFTKMLFAEQKLFTQQWNILLD